MKMSVVELRRTIAISLVLWLSNIIMVCEIEAAALVGSKSQNRLLESNIDNIWANSGEDKVTRDETRAGQGRKVTNSIWSSDRVSLFGARNEVVSFNLVLEAARKPARGVHVEISNFVGPGGAVIENKAVSKEDIWNFGGRNIELFYIRYLEIKGVSTLTYNYWVADDNERHLPKRLRRPQDPSGRGLGGWKDRPDHNKQYPDIAVPLELETPFSIKAGKNQSIWVDIYIPKSTSPGKYQAKIGVYENGKRAWQIPVQLVVKSFSLPDLPSARTMLFINDENVNFRYLGKEQPVGISLVKKSREVIDRHFQLAHRHKISLVDAYKPTRLVPFYWGDRLSGKLFTLERGYDGVGVGIGNNVYSIGTYSTWPWNKSGRATFWRAADHWVEFLESQELTTPTDYFLYLIDESNNFAETERWADWIKSNPGPGRRLDTLATLDLPKAVELTPSLDIPASTPYLGMIDSNLGDPKKWHRVFEKYSVNAKKKLFMYNGSRPVSGSFALDDDGISPRQLAWVQYKMDIDRWFVWESTYYHNNQYGMGRTNVFANAHTYGGRDRVDVNLGETGTNYDNGNGVLFYPGTDTLFPEESYGVAAPIASLRLKHWRRGLQDHDYLTIASKLDAQRVTEIVERMIPKVLWESDAPGYSDPSFAQGDISWSSDPDHWEAARKELADIIEKSQPGH